MGNTIPLWTIEIDTKVFAELVVKKYPYKGKKYTKKELISEGQVVLVTRDGKEKKEKGTLGKLNGDVWEVTFNNDDVKSVNAEIEPKVHQGQQIHELLEVIKNIK